MNAKSINIVEHKLNALHNDAKKDFLKMGLSLARSIGRSIRPSDFENVYLPISKKQGAALKQMIIDNNCKTVVEFGTSFGISTIYLADGVKETGGKVITTELLKTKSKIAKQNIIEAGLNEYVELRTGDAMKTLQDYKQPLDFLFLDGWKDLYLPLFKQLTPYFHTGTLIYADNVDMSDTLDYTDFLYQNDEIYSSQLVHQGKGLLSIVK